MRLKYFLAFAFLNFWPVALASVIFAPVFALFTLITDNAQDRWLAFAMCLAVVLVPLGMIWLCYWLCGKLFSWIKRGFVVYLFWLLMGFMFCYLIAASIAGTSMAVAEGVTKGLDLFLQEITFAGTLLFFTQTLVIPWVFICVTIMKKSKINFFPDKN
jgi:type III secretory pathway component EscS